MLPASDVQGRALFGFWVDMLFVWILFHLTCGVSYVSERVGEWG